MPSCRISPVAEKKVAELPQLRKKKVAKFPQFRSVLSCAKNSYRIVPVAEKIVAELSQLRKKKLPNFPLAECTLAGFLSCGKKFAVFRPPQFSAKYPHFRLPFLHKIL